MSEDRTELILAAAFLQLATWALVTVRALVETELIVLGAPPARRPRLDPLLATRRI